MYGQASSGTYMGSTYLEGSQQPQHQQHPGQESYGQVGYGAAGGGCGGSRPSQGSPHGGFFAAGAGQAKASQTPRRKPQVNLVAVLVSLLGPIAVFSVVLFALSCSLRRSSPALAWIVVAVAGLATAGTVYQAVATIWRRSSGLSERDPFWYLFLAASMAIAFCIGFRSGESSFWNNIVPYQELQTLDSRFDVDPSINVGQQLMDAGRVTFSKGTTLNLTQSMGFKNGDQYCVAPIVKGGSRPKSYDFWAIGLNCCSGGVADFHCGDFDNPNARAGLRIMREDQRAFYRLAVQQAEAAYSIRATHPLFFYWVEDPKSEMESYKDDAMRGFVLGTVAFSSFQLVLVLVGVMVHSKL